MPLPSYRDKQKSVIVRTAREILISDGLDGLQARRIARGSDCSVGTIYNLFGSLDMLIIAANAETLGDLHGELVKARENKQEVHEQLDALSRAYLTFALERTHEWRALFEHRFTTKTTVPDWYRESQGDLFEIVEQTLASAVAQENDRKEAARAMFSAVHGVVSLALDQKLGDFDRAATERQVSFIVTAVARGLENNHRNEEVAMS